MAYSQTWVESFPPDTQQANLLGDDIRTMKTALSERISSFGAGLLSDRPTPEAVWGSATFGVLFWATDTSQVFRWNGGAWVDVTSDFIAASAASFLATSGAPVDVVSAAPPSVGQVLKATDATHATWQTLTGSNLLVASQNLLSNAADLPATTLYAVPAGKSGLYKATYALLCTAIAGAGVPVTSPVINWNNGVIAATFTDAGIELFGAAGQENYGTPLSEGFTMYAVQGTNIQYATSTSGGAIGTGRFDLRMRLEFLG